MMKSTDAEAYYSTRKKKQEGYDIGRRHRVRFEYIKGQGNEDKDTSTQEMRVDIDRFVVHLEQTLERSEEGIGYRTIVGQYEMIVLSPSRELIVIE